MPILVALIIGGVIGAVLITRGATGLFWALVSVAGLWLVCWLLMQLVALPLRFRWWRRGEGWRD